MPVHLRPMTFADLPAVAELEQQCFPNPWPLRAFKHELRDSRTSVYVVATAGERIVGYTGARMIHDEAHITNLAVAPDCRGQAVAKRLLLHLLDHGRTRGVVRFTLEVRESNEAARSLYRRFGFVGIALRQKYYHNPSENALIMWIPDVRAPEAAAAIERIRRELTTLDAAQPPGAVSPETTAPPQPESPRFRWPFRFRRESTSTDSRSEGSAPS